MTVGLVGVSYRTLPSTGERHRLQRALPFGSPLGVVIPRPVAYRTSSGRSWPVARKEDNGLILELLQLPGRPAAVVIETGSTSHTVLLDCAIAVEGCGAAELIR